MADILDEYRNALDNTGAFYRRPLPGIPGKPICFSNQKVGVNKLKTFMKSICQKGGLTGNYTNHSAKRTCATQLYNNDIDEQEIMKRTGHRSTTAVRKYKRSSDEISASVSRILDPPKSTIQSENCKPVGYEDDSDFFEIPRKRVCTDSVLKEVNGHDTKIFNNCEIHNYMVPPKSQ